MGRDREHDGVINREYGDPSVANEDPTSESLETLISNGIQGLERRECFCDGFYCWRCSGLASLHEAMRRLEPEEARE